MKVNKFISLLIISLLFISGCASPYYGNKKILKTKYVTSKDSKVLTKNEIETKLGKPNNIFEKDNKEVYEYVYSKIRANYWLLTPVIGFIAGFMVSDISYKIQYLYCYFDKEGNMVNTERIKYSGFYPPKMPKLPK